MTVKLRVRPRGPLLLEIEEHEAIMLEGADGEPIDLCGRRKVALCRCGASGSRPFCDGSHNRVAFEAPPAEPAEADETA